MCFFIIDADDVKLDFQDQVGDLSN